MEVLREIIVEFIALVTLVEGKNIKKLALLNTWHTCLAKLKMCASGTKLHQSLLTKNRFGLSV